MRDTHDAQGIEAIYGAMEAGSAHDVGTRSDGFARRHLGPRPQELAEMLEVAGAATLDELVSQTVPSTIMLQRDLTLTPAKGEQEALRDLKALASKNKMFRSLIGSGYHACHTPPVILRNVLENPGWYTQYTPYQAEISQGRLEAMLNFQTMVADLSGLPVANASLLDEATAAAEAMAMCFASSRQKRRVFVADAQAHPQTLSVMGTRAGTLGIDLVVAELANAEFGAEVCGVYVQNPDTLGRMRDVSDVCERAHAAGALAVVGADLLSLLIAMSPGTAGADIAVGTTQRFGMPLGLGGPHAAWMAVTDRLKRLIPGRIIGVSVDAAGRPACRLAIQTREQHIRRERATSNICTAQVLPGIVASMYAVYHGPHGLRQIAERVHHLADTLATLLAGAGCTVSTDPRFDTVFVSGDGVDVSAVRARAEEAEINLRYVDGGVVIALDERSDMDEVRALAAIVSGAAAGQPTEVADSLDGLRRTDAVLTHPVFHSHHAEHEMLRYLNRLQGRDLSLTTSMIPLGSCTMKLNATAEMIPITWPEFAEIHPYAPADQWVGYREMFDRLEAQLAELTGFAGVSLQPNAGSQGEYAGLLVIRRYHEARGDGDRDICLIPTSAHGTNPASAVIAGQRVVAVACDERGNIDLEDLQAQASKYADTLASMMITYPSTHGVFEEGVQRACEIVHEAGGLVYMDGANMNAQVGLCRPGDIGADVCHLNLHKTFCIPHGGGGPGMGPIACTEALAPYLPGDPVSGKDAVSAANYGSGAILPISFMYIDMMGADGLRAATEVAILNANYMAARLRPHFGILYTGANGRVAHEFIMDLREFKQSAGIGVEDVAKRLMDYGFHAPTMSWPVAGTLMVEPTESESRQELDRFCDAMIQIREEIRRVEEGVWPQDDNPLVNAPHPVQDVVSDAWAHAYSREDAAYPLSWVRERKFWPAVSRVDNGYGDRNLICTCPSVADLAVEG